MRLLRQSHRVYYGLLFLSMALVVFAGWISLRSAREMEHSVSMTQHSQTVLASVQQAMVGYGLTESFGLRWAMSLDDAYWQPFQNEMVHLDEQVALLQNLVADDPEQKANALVLASAVAKRRAHGERVWQRLRENGPSELVALMRTGTGMSLGQQIMAAAGAMVLRENELLAQRQGTMRDRVREAAMLIAVSIGLALASGMLGVMATIHSRRAWIHRREAEYEREKAVAASQQKSLFLATMSHEIRTPMNAIFGFSQLLARRIHDPKALDYIRAIRTSGQSLLALINDLLDLSRIEAGRMELKRVPTDLREVLDSTLSVFTDQAAAKGLSLSGTVDPFVPTYLELDPHRLRQVLVNLVSNAVKYTDRGSVTVLVTFQPPAERGSVLQLSVEDTGMGIAAEQIERIFEPFHRVPLERAEMIEGTGLGLSIVRRLVELMGGNMGVESTPRHGSKFTVRLFDVAAVSVAKAAAGSKATTADFAKLARARILVVDDIELNRELMLAYLGDAGHALEVAADGLHAIEKVHDWRPTVVLMDLRMPNMDGREATRRLREMPNGHDLCIVAVTASSTTGDEHTARQLFDGHLHKPVSPRELYDCLVELIGTRKHPEGCSIDGSTARDEAKDGAASPQTPEQAAASETALAELEDVVRLRLPHVQSMMRMRDLRLLAEDLAGIARRGSLDRLGYFAARLQAAVETFDMTTIDTMLDQLPRHAEGERGRLAER